jgi:predicted dehydrogenase
MRRIKASVIGLQGHAGVHSNLLKQNPNVVLDRVLYHRRPPPEYSHLPVTNNLGDCLKSDLIIISSPTATHYDYMKALVDFPGYILLEKPAVNHKGQIKDLINLSSDLKSRTRVNFNLAFHDLTALLDESINGGKLGKVFALDVHSSHGVAFKKEWQNAWRILGKTGLGPLETTGIHYVQFSLKMFGRCLSSYIDTDCLSGVPSAVDTGILNMKMEGGVWVRIRHSYAAPYGVRVEVWGTDGFFVYDGEVASIHYPRDTFDSDGLFVKPPLQNSWEIDFKRAWLESLQRAQSDFVKVVGEGVRLDPAEFDRDVAVMNVFLGTQESAQPAVDTLDL